MKNKNNFRLSLENAIVDSNYLDVFPDTEYNDIGDIDDLIGFNIRVNDERFSLNNDSDNMHYFHLDKYQTEMLISFLQETIKQFGK